MQKNAVVPPISQHIQLISDLNIRSKTIKLLEENIGINLCDHVLGNGFLGMISKAQVTKGKITWVLLKLKNFLFQRVPSKKWTDLQNGKNICKSYIW